MSIPGGTVVYALPDGMSGWDIASAALFTTKAYEGGACMPLMDWGVVDRLKFYQKISDKGINFLYWELDPNYSNKRWR